MTRLTAVEAVTATTAATARLSGLLGLLTVAGHVSRLATVEAIAGTATAAATRLSWFFGLLTVAGHVARFTAVEAVLATAAGTTTVAALAALLAPADTKLPASKVMTIEVIDCLLSMLLLVEVDEPEGTLYRNDPLY